VGLVQWSVISSPPCIGRYRHGYCCRLEVGKCCRGGLLLRGVGAAGGHLAAFAFVLDEVGGLRPGRVRAGHVPGGLEVKGSGRRQWLTADWPGLAFVFGACPGVQLGG